MVKLRRWQIGNRSPERRSSQKLAGGSRSRELAGCRWSSGLATTGTYNSCSITRDGRAAFLGPHIAPIEKNGLPLRKMNLKYYYLALMSRFSALAGRSHPPEITLTSAFSGARRLELRKVMIDEIADQIGNRIELQLIEDTTLVGADGSDVQVQLGRDLATSLAHGKGSHYDHLAGG